MATRRSGRIIKREETTSPEVETTGLPSFFRRSKTPLVTKESTEELDGYTDKGGKVFESDQQLKAYKAISDRLADAEKKLLDANRKIQVTERALGDRVQNLDRKIEEKQIKSIEALGIFVALFSYIAVSIQIFSRISDLWSAAIFTWLIFCCLAIFVILLDLLLVRSLRVLTDKKDQSSGLDFRFVLIMLFILVAGLSAWSLRRYPANPVSGSLKFEAELEKTVDERITYKIKEQTYNKSQIDSATSSLQLFKNCIRATGNLWSCI